MGVPSPHFKGLAGGPPGHIPFLVAQLRECGYQVYEEYYGGQKDRQSLLQSATVLINSIRGMRRTLKKEKDKIDLIHLNTAFDWKTLIRDNLTVIGLRSYHKPIFIKCHGSERSLVTSKNFAAKALRYLLFKQTAGIGVLSTEEKNNFIKGGCDPDKLFVVKNIVKNAPSNHSSALFERWGIPSEKPLLLFVARFIKAKGLLDVVRAVGIVCQSEHDPILVCVGDGPEKPTAEVEIAKLGIGESVHFTGYIPETDTHDFYANASVLVFPTFHDEGFPMVVFRSLAAGLPIITTQIRAASDYLQEPDNCLWTEPRNPEVLAQKIVELLGNEHLTAAMSANNKNLALRFNQETVTNEYVAIYHQIAKAEVITEDAQTNKSE